MQNLALVDTPQLRKARGAFFTPPEVARFVVDWAIRQPTDTVLEPSCGEAAFLLAAGHRLQSLGGFPRGIQLAGVELHEGSAQTASTSMMEGGFEAAISVGDFFSTPIWSRYDAVVGNPPYIRYQEFSGRDRLKAQLAAKEQGVKIPGLASSWAAFTVHAAAFLKGNGRLGLVLPAELLSVNYAAPVRRFLMERFGSVRIVLFDGNVFPGVLEEVVLLLAEGTGPTEQCELFQARDLSSLSELKSRIWVPRDRDEKWSSALLSAEVAGAYSALLDDSKFAALADWGSTNLGMVTGNNSFFALTAEGAAALSLRNDEVLPISPPSSRHLRGLTFSRLAWRSMVEEGRQAYLFYPNAAELSPGARRYIAEGEAAGVHEAYKCRIRSPWYQVPLLEPPDLFLTYMNHDAPRVVANRAQVRCLNSVHGVFLKRGLKQLGADVLPLAMLNSLTLLGAELVGRSYGGGVLKLEPREASRLPVPSVDAVEAAASELRAIKSTLAPHFRHGNLDAVVKIVDKVILRRVLGLDRSGVELLSSARSFLFERRAGRGRAK